MITYESWNTAKYNQIENQPLLVTTDNIIKMLKIYSDGKIGWNKLESGKYCNIFTDLWRYFSYPKNCKSYNFFNVSSMTKVSFEEKFADSKPTYKQITTYYLSIFIDIKLKARIYFTQKLINPIIP